MPWVSLGGSQEKLNASPYRAKFVGAQKDAMILSICHKLSACLLDYYEKVRGLAGVGGETTVPKRKFGGKPAAAAAAAENNTEGASSQHTAEEVGDIDAVSPPAGAAAAGAAAAGAAAEAPAAASSPAGAKKAAWKGAKENATHLSVLDLMCLAVAT